MRIALRKLLSNIASKELKAKLKKLEYKWKKLLVKRSPVLNAERLRKLLTEDLGIKRGDHLFVHGSADMINTELSAREIVTILMDVVGEEGSLSVPTFIRYSSKEWMTRPDKFHSRKTVSGMGMISEVVRKNKSSRRSLHPTKSVATIGPIASDVLGEHHLSPYPFGPQSPFCKLLKYNVKVVGLGVTMSYLSMVHTVEDCYPASFPMQVNEPEVFAKVCVDEQNEEVLVETFVHDLAVVVKANVQKFIFKYLNPMFYKSTSFYFTPFFVVDGNALFQELHAQMNKGRTIYD